MKYLKNVSIASTCLVLLFIMFPYNVNAYLDPGTGSYFLQLTIAGLLGSFLTVKIYWKKLKNMFFKLISRRNKIE